MSPHGLAAQNAQVRSSVTVATQLTFSVREPAEMSLQVVAANDRSPGLVVDIDRVPIPVREVLGPEPFGRQHLVDAQVGTLRVAYSATVLPGPRPGAVARVDDAERVLMLRPSRFCPSDRLIDYGSSRLPGPETGPLHRVQAITEYVSEHLEYVAGSTGPIDDAVDVLLAGRGVCRDYAHLVVTLARAQGMAARFVSVYAPGLSPMDFHAVAEIEIEGTWHVVDATRLAPRESLVRISTGRDAADTAFATTLQGLADLVEVSVMAVADGGLTVDDGRVATVLT
jgi:transglutaminase-like putative cysteine protease